MMASTPPAWIAAAVILLAACGGPARRPCAESIHARAAGGYAHEDAGHARRTYDSHIRSCNLDCVGRDNHNDPASCTEKILLGFDIPGHDVVGVEELLDYCHRGVKAACDWVAQNQELSDRTAKYRADHPRPLPVPVSERTASRGAPDDGSEVSRFVSALKSTASGDGYTVVADDNYTLSEGYTAVRVPSIEPGIDYVFTIVARRTTTFTARIRGFGIDAVPFVVVPGSSTLFVRALLAHLDAADIDQPQIIITADGGDQGTVRVVQTKRKR